MRTVATYFGLSLAMGAVVCGGGENRAPSTGAGVVDRSASLGAQTEASPSRVTPSGKSSGSLARTVAKAKAEVVSAGAAGPAAPANTTAASSGTVVVATVGAAEISMRQFTAIYDLKAKKYVDRGRELPLRAAKRYRESILERLTHQELLRQETTRRGVEYSEPKLRARIESQKRGVRDWPKHLARRGETEATLEQMYIAEQREVAVLDAQGALEVTPAELEAEYAKTKSQWSSEQERVRASHILVALDETSDVSEAKAKADAEVLYAKASAPGADFGGLARAHSSGPSATKGGDLGIFARVAMTVEFADAAFGLKVGAVSKPVRTKYGYHIIKLLGRWPKGTLPLEAVQDQLAERLAQRKLYRGRRALREQLEAATDIRRFLDPASGAISATGTVLDKYKDEPRGPHGRVLQGGG